MIFVHHCFMPDEEWLSTNGGWDGPSCHQHGFHHWVQWCHQQHPAGQAAADYQTLWCTHPAEKGMAMCWITINRYRPDNELAAKVIVVCLGSFFNWVIVTRKVGPLLRIFMWYSCFVCVAATVPVWITCQTQQVHRDASVQPGCQVVLSSQCHTAYCKLPYFCRCKMPWTLHFGTLQQSLLL